MKRVLCLILVLLVCLSGCSFGKHSDTLEPVEFYYPRKSASFAYGVEDGVITAEIREASGHVTDLNYLITMYLYGPLEDDLRSPFPTGCMLKGIHADGETLYIRLSEVFTTLENTELTLACAALAKTCLSMTDFTQITIEASSGEKNVSMTLDENSMQFADFSMPEATESNIP